MTVFILVAVACVMGVGVLLVACVALGARSEPPSPTVMEPHESQEPIKFPSPNGQGSDPPDLGPAVTDLAA